jgi:hypothetical protein
VSSDSQGNNCHLIYIHGCAETHCKVDCIRWAGIDHDLLCPSRAFARLEIVDAAMERVPDERSDTDLCHLMERMTTIKQACGGDLIGHKQDGAIPADALHRRRHICAAATPILDLTRKPKASRLHLMRSCVKGRV